MNQSNDRIFYVYGHFRKTDDSIFYLGKGKQKRSHSKSGRSDHWRSIAKKHGWYVKIIASGLTETEAYDLEVKAIKELREKGERICNVANGGEGGLSGIKLKPEHIKKLSAAKLGKPQLPEHAERSRKARLGCKNTPENTEKLAALKRKKVINNHGEVFNSATEAARVLSKRIGVNCNQGNISMCCMGKRSNAYGYSWSYSIDITPDFRVFPGRKKQVKNISNGMLFDSVQDAKDWVSSIRDKKANNQIISACARGDLKTAYGYEWIYIQ